MGTSAIGSVAREWEAKRTEDTMRARSAWQMKYLKGQFIVCSMNNSTSVRFMLPVEW